MGEVTETVAEGAKTLIDRAVRNKISDIHIDPLPNLVTVRYRRAGRLYVANKLPKSSGKSLAAYFKKMANLEEGICNAPQSGSCELKSGRRSIQLDVTVMPVLDGEKITLHLTELSKSFPALSEVGLWGAALSSVNHALVQPGGLILVAGPKTSDTSLILNSMLQTLEPALPRTAYVGSAATVPSFVEQFSLYGAVPPERRLRILEKDGIEVLAVEGFKDASTVETAIEIAASKKLVLNGLVATNVGMALNSLKPRGKNHLVAANLRLVMGQTFVKTLCGQCREAYEPSTFEQKQLNQFFGIGSIRIMKRIHELEKAALGQKDPESLSSSEKSIGRLWRPKPGGCKTCDYTGHNGSIGIFEVYEPSDNFRVQISAGRSAQTLQQSAEEDGMINLQTDGLIKALLGLIDLPTLLSLSLGV